MIFQNFKRVKSQILFFLRGGILYNFIRMRYSIDSPKISPYQKQLSMGGDVQQIEEAT